MTLSRYAPYRYDAFGVEYDLDPEDTNPWRYCGEYFDVETGTVYLRARYYDPVIGRFTQQDGWGYANPRDPLSLNLYVYCGNSPVMFWDPSGHFKAGDEEYKKSNPIVYEALDDLTNSWNRLDSLEKSGVASMNGITIKEMKIRCRELADEVRRIGNETVVVNVTAYSLCATETVFYSGHYGTGTIVYAAAVEARINLGSVFGAYDGTYSNALTHAKWNAMSVVLTGGDAVTVRLFTDAHEYGQPGNFTKEYLPNATMDLHNNAVGSAMGSSALAAAKRQNSFLAIPIAVAFVNANIGKIRDQLIWIK